MFGAYQFAIEAAVVKIMFEMFIFSRWKENMKKMKQRLRRK